MVYFDSFITAGDCTNIRTTAKEIQVPEKQFIAWMLKNKYLYRTAKGYLMPYAKKSTKCNVKILPDIVKMITDGEDLASRIRESA